MNLSNLESILKNEPAYRLIQVKKAVFCDLIEDWDGAKFLPAGLRGKLKAECPLDIKADLSASKDGRTIKVLVTLADGLKIESVLMRYANRREAGADDDKEFGRNTVCVSSQVGCPMACSFCATGRLGLERNLSQWEIIEQVLLFARLLKKSGDKVTNIVFMGMGEPFLNYDNVMSSIKILNDKDGFNLGIRHISISTCGIVDGMEKFSNENIEVNLAISLHAPNNELRSKLMPVNKKYPLEKVLKAVDDYVKKTRRKVMFEYVMIKDVNDTDNYARELAKLMAGRKLAMVNLIPYNPVSARIVAGLDATEQNKTAQISFNPSSPERIQKFFDILKKSGVQATIRYRFGRDVKAACGQLAGEVVQ